MIAFLKAYWLILFHKKTSWHRNDLNKRKYLNRREFNANKWSYEIDIDKQQDFTYLLVVEHKYKIICILKFFMSIPRIVRTIAYYFENEKN